MTSPGTTNKRDSEAVQKARDILKGQLQAPLPRGLLSLTEKVNYNRLKAVAWNEAT